MFLKVLRDFSKPHWIDIIQVLKRSTGLSVAELAKALNMSYMGIKQHCVDLEKKGYLDTWRRAKPVGRPEKLYRLTKKAAPLFPSMGSAFTIDVLSAVAQTYGNNAPDKLLFNYFQKQGDRYAAKVKGQSVADRAVSLAKLRDAEGFCSSCGIHGTDGLQIVEYHSLLAEVAAKYPTVHRMEEQMFGRVLKTTVERTEEQASGLTAIRFSVGTL